jgi:hypothetical protein
MAIVEVLSFPVLITFAVFAFIFLSNQQKARVEERREKLRILEEALQNERLDPRTRDDVYEVLTGRRPGTRPDPSDVGAQGRLLFTIGWLGLFVGGGVLVASRHNDTTEIGLVVLIASFGLLSLPLAMRELRSRHQRPV